MENESNLTKLHWLHIFIMYVASNMFLLVNQGVFWDDWLIFENNFNEINRWFIRCGHLYLTYIHYFLQNLSINPPIVYHTVTVALGLISTVIFYKILKYFKLSSYNLFLLTLFFAVIPYNQAKSTLICLPSTISLFLLLLGVLTFLVSINRKNVSVRIISIVLLFISFTLMNSGLVIWLAFLLFYSIYKQKEIKLRFSFFMGVIRHLFLWFDYAVLPFVFWITKYLYFQPTGILSDQSYNEVSIERLFFSPINIIFSFYTNTFGVISESFRPIMESQSFEILFSMLFVIIYYSFYKLKLFHLNYHINNHFLFIGVYFFIAGIFPYAVVEKNPSFSGYATRGQILLPIGMSFILLYSISLFGSKKIRQLAYIILVTSFIIANISSQVKYTKSWFKQEALIAHIKKDSLFIPHNNYLLFDRTTEYDENERGLSHWALSGLLEKALGHTACFMIETKDRATYRHDMKFQYYYLIDKGELMLKTKTVLLLLYQYYFKKHAYYMNIDKIIDCQVVPITEKTKI